MIPALSVMIAAYTITRMLDMLARENTKTLVKVVASISIVITLVAVIGIMGAGSQVSTALPY
jgi:multisubunit Na+/H+ antiporter MnhG subunit